MTENVPSPVNLEFNLRVFKRVAEMMPKKVPELVRSFAEDGDLDLLEAILKIGIAEPTTGDARADLLAAIFPVSRTATDKARGRDLVNNWLGCLGVGSDPASLSIYLADVSWATAARELIALGADPNYSAESFEGGRTPVGKAFTMGRQSVVTAMLDNLLELGEVPLYSIEPSTAPSGDRVPTTLFSTLSDGMDNFVPDYLLDHDLPDTWRAAIGDAITEYNNRFPDGFRDDDFEPLCKLLASSKLEDPARWQRALSRRGYMEKLTTMSRMEPMLSRIAHASVEGGVDINSWRAPLRLHNIDYPVPILAVAVQRGRRDLVQQYLELGADMNFKMPALFDAPGKPYSGPTLIQYAQQEPAAGDTHQILAAWRAHEAVRNVTDSLRTAHAKGAA